VKDDDGAMVKKTASRPAPGNVGTPPPAPDEPMQVTDEEFGRSSHARIVRNYQDDPGFRHRTHAGAYARAKAALIIERTKRQGHKAYGDAVKARVAAKPKDEWHPNALAPDVRPWRVWYVPVPRNADGSMGTPKTGRHYRLSVEDTPHPSGEPRIDKIQMHDRLWHFDELTTERIALERVTAINMSDRSIETVKIAGDSESE
jgi:hypothetical protein